MDNFNMEQLLCNKNLEEIVKEAKKNWRNSYLQNNLEKYFHKLFDKVDWELKQNTTLNNSINDSVKIKEAIEFDIKNFFMVFDKDKNGRLIGESHFSQAYMDSALSHIDIWPEEKAMKETEIWQLEKQKLFKAFAQMKIDKLAKEISEGDELFKKYTKIFQMNEENQKLDKDALKNDYEKLVGEINSKIDEVIDKHLQEELSRHPELITMSFVLGGKYGIPSTVFMSNENNKNLEKFFDSRKITKKLKDILGEYLKQKSERNNMENEELNQEKERQ